MPDTWHDFYLMAGIAAAALVGLLFIVVTLITDRNPAVTLRASRIYVTPTVFHFAVVVLLSMVSLIPAGRPGMVGSIAIACGLGGVGYAANVALNLYGRHRPDVMHWSDPVFYALLPVLTYVGLVVAGAAFLLKVLNAPYFVATAVIILLLLAARDTWDVALWLATHPEHEGGTGTDKPGMPG